MNFNRIVRTILGIRMVHQDKFNKENIDNIKYSLFSLMERAEADLTVWRDFKPAPKGRLAKSRWTSFNGTSFGSNNIRKWYFKRKIKRCVQKLH